MTFCSFPKIKGVMPKTSKAVVPETTQDGPHQGKRRPSRRENLEALCLKASKRKSPAVAIKSAVKKRRPSDSEAKALQEFGHLVDQNPKRYIPHSKGPEAIPSAPTEDSEFEDEIFIQESRSTLWQTYKGLLLEILEQSEMSEAVKDRVKVLAFDICVEEDTPMMCPLEDCLRTKPVYSRVGFLRHIVEKHLPLRPMWRCPYKNGQCDGHQPRRVAHVRHVGWTHGRNYALAAALTFRDNLRYLEPNGSFDPWFVVRGPRSRHFYNTVEEVPPPANTRREYNRVVFSSSSSSSSSEDLDESECCELAEEVAAVDLLLQNSGEAPASTLPPSSPPPVCEAPASNLALSTTPSASDIQTTTPVENTNNDEVLRTAPNQASLPSPEPKVEVCSAPEVPKVVELPLPQDRLPREKAVSSPDENATAAGTLVEIMAKMDQPTASPPLKHIPELFLFEAGNNFVEPSVGEIERMICGIHELQLTHQKQNHIHESLIASLKGIKVTVDEHEGNIKLTSEQLQATVDLKKKLFREQQNVAFLTDKCSHLEERKQELHQELSNKNRSVQLLEDHVRTLQADVKRLTEDNKLAATKMEEVQTKLKTLEASNAFVSKVTLLLQEDGLLK